MKHKRNRKQLPKVTVEELKVLKKLFRKNKELLLQKNFNSESSSEDEQCSVNSKGANEEKNFNSDSSSEDEE